MAKLKAVVSSIGGCAFAVFLTTASMYFFTTPKYSTVVFWLMIGSAAVCFVFVSLWFHIASLERKSAKAGLPIISDIGGENSGTQMTAGRDIHYYPPGKAPHLPAAPATVAVLAPIAEPPTRTRTAAAIALQFRRRTEQVIFDYMRAGWRLANQGEAATQTALVLWIENPYPIQGTGRNLSNLIASIRAQQLDSITIPRAYWIGQRDNEVNLHSGDELGVLVGYFDGRDRFICYDNPHPPPTYHIMDDGFRELGRRATLDLVVRDQDTTPVTITVTIAQVPEQTVIACKRIIVTLPQRIVDMRDCDE
jgi:hypothetical protein